MDQAKPNPQSVSDIPSSNTLNTRDLALPPIAPENLLPPVTPSTLEKPKLKNERHPELKAQNAEQTEQNTPGTGKNHPRNRRRKEIKRLKQALEPYPDLKAVFETEVLPQDLEELTTIAKYYYLKIKYKNNQAL